MILGKKRWLIAMLTLGVLVSIPTAGSGVLAIDVHTTREVQNNDLPYTHILALIGNFIGSTVGGILIAAPFVAWLLAARRSADALFLVAIVVLRTTNAILKSLAESPRPHDKYGVEVTEQASGPGFPSGHSMGAVLLILGLVYIVYRTNILRSWYLPFLVIGAALILITGYSRIYVGAHWPSDVIGGYLWGMTFFLAYTWFHFSACNSPRLQSVMDRLTQPDHRR